VLHLLVPALEAVPGPLHGLQEDRRIVPVAQHPEIRRAIGAQILSGPPGEPASGVSLLQTGNH
jgi:hypothetical protein